MQIRQRWRIVCGVMLAPSALSRMGLVPVLARIVPLVDMLCPLGRCYVLTVLWASTPAHLVLFLAQPVQKVRSLDK